MRATIILATIVIAASAHAAPATSPARLFDDVRIQIDGDYFMNDSLVAPEPAEAGADGVDIIFNVHGVLYLASGIEMAASAGAPGMDAFAQGVAHGSNGGRGGDIHLHASRIVSYGAKLSSGGGGRGGDAIATGIPDAKATGGAGGDAGVVTIVGPVHGLLRIIGGSGGPGGNAQAIARNGENCDSRDGGHATANTTADLSILAPSRDANATADDGTCAPVEGTGGTGGDAWAHGGIGGASVDGNGGKGGNASAIAGRGGDGTDACYSRTDAAAKSGIVRGGHGGDGGAFWAVGGNGGDGLLRGGDGGAAFGRDEGGDGGYATAPIKPGNGGSNARPLKEGEELLAQGGSGGSGNVGGSGGGASSVFGVGSAGRSCGAVIYRNFLPEILATIAAAALVTTGAVFGIRRLRR